MSHLQRSGFTKLTANKYLADVSGVARQNALELPESVCDRLKRDDVLLERARIAPPDHETLGQFSGQLVDVQAVSDLSWGARIPVPQSVDSETMDVQIKRAGVCLTFADGDQPLSHEAMGFRKIVEHDGLSLFKDILED